MINMKITLDNTVKRQLQKDLKFLKNLPQDAYKFFVAQTPVKTGNARRSTDLVKDTIVADYPYAQRLDNGWSRQSPNGMVKPTERFIDREINKKIGK
jgi:hypothetical protein